jgi:endo-1,4-beta-D-glucanase Y
MKRRLFIQSGSAAVALTLAGCGGGGGGGAAETGAVAAADTGLVLTPELEEARRVAKNATTQAAAVQSGAQAPGTQPLPSDTAAAAPADPAAAPSPQANSGSGYPFGSRKERYVAGIGPNQSPAAMDSLLTRHYDAWKAANVVRADSVVPGGYAVQFSNHHVLAVSEGMGYGMLLAVVFAGHDPEARTLFDGLLAMVRARPAYAVVPRDPNGKYLMDWRINADGSPGEGWNAMDGDLDIAMALLMADRQWGSGGRWNYLQEGKNTIEALKSWNMKANGTTKGLPNDENNRTSDYMIGHFRAFHAATGDKLWERAIDKAHKLIEKLQREYSPNAGLIPDFVVNTDGNAAPSPGYIGDGNANEHHYWWNACRNPWRFSSDFMLSGDQRFADVTAKMISFFERSSGGDPLNLGTGYALDGTMLTGGNSPAYSGPILAGACVDARFQGFVDAMWNWNARNLNTGYYDSEIQLLSMVVASGNWWTPVRG